MLARDHGDFDELTTGKHGDASAALKEGARRLAAAQSDEDRAEIQKKIEKLKAKARRASAFKSIVCSAALDTPLLSPPARRCSCSGMVTSRWWVTTSNSAFPPPEMEI